MKSTALSRRIAQKLFDSNSLKHGTVDDYAIVRSRAGKNQLANGAFSWNLVYIPNSHPGYGCYDRASDMAQHASLCFYRDEVTGALVIE